MPNNRFDVRYSHRFTEQTDNGKAFKWLKDNLGSACDDAITNAIRLLYLPIALAEAGATSTEVETEVKKAREYFNEKMMAALGSCCEGESSIAAFSNSATPVPLKSVYPTGVVQVLKKNTDTAIGTAASYSAIDPDDDFLELDEDKIMEGM